MAEDRRARLKDWLARGEARLHPLTLPQRELWETSPVPAADISNHICTVTTIRGPVSSGLCERAMAMVVEKQEVLRLSVLPGKNGPVQLVRKKQEPSVRFHTSGETRGDAGDAGDAGAAEAIDARVPEFIRAPFDLVAGPLYRVDVLRLSAETHLLVLVIHHAIADGWTLGVFMSDLWAAYAQLVLGVPGGLEPVPLSYTDWGAADRAFWTPKVVRSRRPFWAARLDGAPRLWDGPPAPADHAGRRERWVAFLPAELTASLKALATARGATFFSTLLTAFQIVMAKATGNDDVLVGSPVAQRNRKAVWETMGSFAGIVPLRGQIDRGLSFAAQLAATHEMTVDSFAHALPFAELVAGLGAPVEPGRNPVFDVRFALQNHPLPDVSMPGMEVDYRTLSTGTARFDLACELTEIGGTMEVVWLFRGDMFAGDDVVRFHGALAGVLAAACDGPETRIATLIENLP